MLNALRQRVDELEERDKVRADQLQPQESLPVERQDDLLSTIAALKEYVESLESQLVKNSRWRLFELEPLLTGCPGSGADFLSAQFEAWIVTRLLIRRSQQPKVFVHRHFLFVN